MRHLRVNQKELFVKNEEWEDPLKKSSVNAKYLVTNIELEPLLFMFMKSLSVAGFSFFVTFLKEITIWMCSLDHTQYAWWISVFIRRTSKSFIYL